MNLNLKLVAAALVCMVGLQAQNPSNDVPKRNCGTQVPSPEWDSWFNQKVEEFKRDRASGRTQATNYTIPVIVHVIYGNQPVGTYPNISQAQINSQIPVLNNDFAGTGLNVANLAGTAFSAVGAANCSISFCMAELDPLGNTLAEPGIERISYNTAPWTNPASINSLNAFENYVDGVIKPATIWDATQYLNIWVTDVNAAVNILGYATFPTGTGLNGIFNGSGTQFTDGIWVWAKTFGNTGTLYPPYTKGRTASHEIGHWLGLRHIWGDGTCATDYCNDTPAQQSANFGCPTYPWKANVCAGSTNGDMFMNFMDYSDDACLYMFTPDQSARMTTAMNNGNFRSQLTASSATLCNQPSIMPVASILAPGTGCADSLIVFSNQSTGSPVPTYSWSVMPTVPGIVFSPNNIAASPTISFSFPTTYTVTMSATNAAGTAVATTILTVDACEAVWTSVKGQSAFDRKIILSPNPSSGIVSINTALPGNRDISVSVHNYLGQFITSANYKPAATSTYQLDLSNYDNGVYFVTISNGQEKTVKRLILNK